MKINLLMEASQFGPLTTHLDKWFATRPNRKEAR